MGVCRQPTSLSCDQLARHRTRESSAPLQTRRALSSWTTAMTARNLFRLQTTLLFRVASHPTPAPTTNRSLRHLPFRHHFCSRRKWRAATRWSSRRRLFYLTFLPHLLQSLQPRRRPRAWTPFTVRFEGSAASRRRTPQPHRSLSRRLRFPQTWKTRATTRSTISGRCHFKCFKQTSILIWNVETHITRASTPLLILPWRIVATSRSPTSHSPTLKHRCNHGSRPARSPPLGPHSPSSRVCWTAMDCRRLSVIRWRLSPSSVHLSIPVSHRQSHCLLTWEACRWRRLPFDPSRKSRNPSTKLQQGRRISINQTQQSRSREISFHYHYRRPWVDDKVQRQFFRVAAWACEFFESF